MNRLTIIGNLTREPETRTTQSGKNVCTFTVAVNRRNDGADYFRVSAWGQLGEICQKYLDKGRKVAVVGSVSVNSYTTQAGEARASLEVTAQDVEFLKDVKFLTPKGGAAEPDRSAADKPQAAGPMEDYTEVVDEDIPF